MILICEPSCKNFSHEKINEGFLYKTRLAFPDDKIIFLGHESHIKILKKNLFLSKIEIGNIDFENIKINTNNSTLGLITNLRIIQRIRIILENYNSKKLFFLSSPKTLIYLQKFLNIKIEASKVFVLHGEFESILNQSNIENKLEELPRENFFLRIKKISYKKLMGYLIKKLIKFDPVNICLSKFEIEEMIKKNHDESYKYIALSDHIIENISAIIDYKNYNISSIYYPQVKSLKRINIKNEFVKFAVFGFGDSKMLYNLNLKIEKLKIKSPFQIRIIGMDNRGIDQFPWVTNPSNGKTLPREEMEKLLEDIDFVLILYPNNRYRASCSGSVIEAITYEKPIIHLKNNCISHFNENNEIGYMCENLDEFSLRILKIAEDYQIEKRKIKEFKNSIIKKQKMISVDSRLKLFANKFN